jgi:hypothetical protein
MKTKLQKSAATAALFITGNLALAQQMPSFPKPPPLPQHAIDMVEQSRRNAGIRPTSELESFAKKVRTIQIDKNSTDDVERKLGKPTGRMKMNWGELWTYVFTAPYGSANDEMVTGSVEFNSMGKVAKVSVMKNNEELYSQGLSHQESQRQQAVGKPEKSEAATPFIFPTAGQPPANPVGGQVYFNSKTKVFMGWNGSEWISLNGVGDGN